MQTQTKKLTLAAMFCALAFIAVAFIRIPVVLFLKYDPKDVIIALGGLILGPVYSVIIAVVSSLVELITISDTGVIGLLMNILSSCAFALCAALIYKRKKTLFGAVLGLILGCISQIIVMMLWNYIITPIYMGVAREQVAAMLVPAFLPFNAIKSGLNAAITFLLYRPVIETLRRAKLMPQQDSFAKKKTYVPLILAAVVILLTCILFILSFQKII